jgi:hypothetical protein
MMELRKFDVGATKPHRTWLIIGARGTGKSKMLQDIIYHTRERYDVGMAMTATTSTANDLRKFLPSRLIYKDGYNFEKADKMLQVCKKMVARGKGKSLLNIQDDVMFESGVLKSKTQKELHFNGRHALTTQVSTTQYCMDIPSNIRGNIDYILALRETTVSNKKKLYEFFFGSFPSFKEFDRVFMHATREFGALVIDKTQPTADIENSIFYYRARTDLPPFRVGRQGFFSLSDKLDEIEKEGERKSAKSDVMLLY